MNTMGINFTNSQSSFDYNSLELAAIHSQKKSLKDHIKKSLLKK